MRYTLFVTNPNISKQLRSSEDLELLKRDADLCQRIAIADDSDTDLEYIVKVGYKLVYNAKWDRKDS